MLHVGGGGGGGGSSSASCGSNSCSVSVVVIVLRVVVVIVVLETIMLHSQKAMRDTFSNFPQHEKKSSKMT